MSTCWGSWQSRCVPAAVWPFLSCLISVAVFDFFCVPPYFTFAVSDYEYILTFAVMLVVAITISTLTIRIRMQAAHAVDRETRTQALYRLTKELTGDQRAFDAARIATDITREVFGCRVVIFLTEGPGKVSFRRRTTDDLPIPRSEEGVAQWAFDHKQRAGRGTDTLPGSTALYLPLRGFRHVVGVMAVLPETPARRPRSRSICSKCSRLRLRLQWSVPEFPPRLARRNCERKPNRCVVRY